MNVGKPDTEILKPALLSEEGATEVLRGRATDPAVFQGY